MPLLGKLEVFAQHGTIVGMSTVLYNLLGSTQWTLTTKVGNALLGDDDINIMFCTIYMATHGYDGRDASILGGTLCGEDGDETITLIVATATDAVHQLAAADVARVLVAIDITLDGGVHGDDSESADDLRRIGNLALTDGKMLLEVVDVIIYLFQCVIGHGE